jgi:NTE family protein
MTKPDRAALGPQTALVLGGGGARGAYEVGVAQVLFEELVPLLGAVPRVDILCGTSAGAINPCGLASFASEPLHGVAALAHRWTELEPDRLLRADRREAVALLRSFLGCGTGRWLAGRRRGGLLDPAPFLEAFGAGMDFTAIGEHLAAGRLSALCLTATEIAAGRTTLFLHRGAGGPRARLPGRPSYLVEEVVHTAEHVLASTAIPLLFPPVRIGGRLYCDGSLRQHVPLSPALHLGASRLVVVTTQSAPSLVPALVREREASYPAPLFMLGKALDALTLDRVDEDLERLLHLNRVMEAGTRAFGSDFVAGLNRQLAPPEQLAPISTVVIRPSASIGAIAAEFVQSPAFRRRMKGTAGRLFARLGESEGEHEADLLSHLLFDGGFAAELIALGREDARARVEELAALFDAPPAQERAPVPAAMK